MKKLFGLLMIVLASVIIAGPPSAPTIYGPTTWEADTAFNITSTITGVDSLTVFTKYRFEPGYEYALRTKVTVPAADSIYWKVIAYGTDKSTQFEVSVFDTMGASETYNLAVLPIGKTILANYATIKALGVVAVKARTFARVEMWRRKSGM